MNCLEQAIIWELRNDPYTGNPPLPETVSAIAEFVRAMCRVSNKRPKEYSNEPWRNMRPHEHAQHAAVHSRVAFVHCYDGGNIDDDGEHHLAHCGLRAAFAMAREGKEKE